MSGDLRTISGVAIVEPDTRALGAASGRRPATAPLAEDSQLAVDIRALVERGELDEARERFS